MVAMKFKDFMYIISGILLAIVAWLLYNTFKPQPVHYYTDNLKLVNLSEIDQQRSNAIVVAADVISPSVVSITVIQTRVVTTSPFFSPFSDDYFNKFFRDFFPERYYRQQIKSLGTGVIIAPEGYVLTNEHVVSNATDIHVTLPDGRQFSGTIIAADHTMDLALLKIEGEALPYALLGNSDELMIGEWVIAFGNPFGFLLEDTHPTVTVGVISALNRAIKSTKDNRVYKNMIQTDAAINPGNSGGPLVNVLGQVVGLNTFIFTSGGGSEGIGFARPINTAKRFIDEAKEHGKVRTPWIGLWVQDIAPERDEPLGIERKGIMVNSIDKGSPAEQAGLREGDRITTVNSVPMRVLTDWDRYVAGLFVDDTLELSVQRGQDNIDVQLVVVELKPAGTQFEFGVYVENINSYVAKKYNLGYKDGVIVTAVKPGSNAERMGLRDGDVILKVGNTRIRDKDDFLNAIKGSRQSFFIVDRGGIVVQIYFGM